MQKSLRENGFSMIELLVALVLMGVLFVGVMAGFSRSTASTGLIHSKVMAINLAKERLEFLKQFEKNGNNRDATVWTFTTTKAINGRNFAITSETVPDTELSTNYQSSQKYVIPVRVTVSWAENSKTRKVVMETFYYEKFSL